jgi:cholesterol transport system auxiliary component
MTRFSPLFALALSACSAFSQASAPLDAYTLQPLTLTPGSTTARHLVVELPTASGALATDRILIKPNPLQAQYQPGARWVDPLPDMVQGLLVASLQNSGRYRLVGRDGAGMTPDFVALVEVNSFEADAPAMTTHVALTVSLLSVQDRRLLATRRFTASAQPAATDTLTLITAFDAATGRVLADAVAWIDQTAR